MAAFFYKHHSSKIAAREKDAIRKPAGVSNLAVLRTWANVRTPNKKRPSNAVDWINFDELLICVSCADSLTVGQAIKKEPGGVSLPDHSK